MSKRRLSRENKFAKKTTLLRTKETVSSETEDQLNVDEEKIHFKFDPAEPKVIVNSDVSEAEIKQGIEDFKQFMENQRTSVIEQSEKILSDARTKAEEYEKSENARIEDLIKSKEEEAEKLTVINREEIEKEVRNEMAESITSANKKADEIIAVANAKAEEHRNELLSREEELKAKANELEEKFKEADNRSNDLLAKQIELDNERISLKETVNSEFQDELKNIREENKNYSAEINEIKRINRRLEQTSKIHEDEVNDFMEEFKSYESAVATKRRMEEQIRSLTEGMNSLSEDYSQKVAECTELREKLNLYGEDPGKWRREYNTVKEECEKLSNLIAGKPSEEELGKLRQSADENLILIEKCNTQQERIRELELEKTKNEVNIDDIENYRRIIKILELQKTELQRQLDHYVYMNESGERKVFANLSDIDEHPYPEFHSSKRVTLREFCDNFRNYLATRKDKTHLYYSETTIRTFVAGLASSRIMILEGLSGTGKSSLPRAFQDYMGAVTTSISVQSSWKDRNDLLGFYNDFKRQYKETEFLKALYSASSDPSRVHCIMLDEMNLSRIEYYFADLLSVLENEDSEDWQIELLSDDAAVFVNGAERPKQINGGKLRVLDNTWFIGTANKDDSTFTITDKVYDRAVVINFEDKGKPFNAVPASPIQINTEDFQNMLDVKWNAADEKRFNDLITRLDKAVKDYFDITFGNRIQNQLEKFVPAFVECGGTVDEAVDVMFSRKILRKLEGRYDDETKDGLNKLLESFKDHMPISTSYIKKMVSRI